MPSESSSEQLFCWLFDSGSCKHADVFDLLEADRTDIVPSTVVKPLANNFIATLNPVFVPLGHINVVN